MPTRRQPRNGRPIEVVLLDSVRPQIQRMVEETSAIDYMEYGGWLLGVSGTPNSVLVVSATGQAPGDSRDFKTMDLSIRQAEIEARYASLSVMGRWHTHPYDTATSLSDTDMDSAAECYRHFGTFTDLLITPGRGCRWSIPQATAYAYEGRSAVSVHDAVLTGWECDAAERGTARLRREEPVRSRLIPAAA